MTEQIELGDWAKEFVYGWINDPDGVEADKFREDFEQVEPQSMGYFLANPKEDFYQGQTYITVYRRKSDGKMFGVQYWQGGGKYGEPYYDPEGEEYDTVILREVEPFTITSYKIKVGEND